MKNNKVCIFSTFYEYDQAYSLCNCVEDQIRMFVDNGYKIKLIVDEDFKSPGGYWSHPSVSYGYTPHDIQRSNDGVLKEGWEQEVDKFYEALKKELEGYKVVIGHDIVLQPAHLIHNLASRRLANERPELRWLHWSHSATAPSVRCSDENAREIIQQKFPNAFMCYPNDWDRDRVAKNYKYELDEVKCVHHPSDFTSLMFGDEIDLSEVENEEVRNKLDKQINYPIRLSKDLVNEFDILDADVIATYPCRLDRGKQPEFLIKTMAKMKEMGRSVRCIIFDFHSTGGDKVVYRDELKIIGKQWGLDEKELIFISEWREDTRLRVPRQMIMNLKKISDFHMHPSTSETYSLVAQESMIWRNFCIMNHHTPYMRDIYGSKNVIHEKFGGAVNVLDMEDGSTNVNIHNEGEYFHNLANKVLYFIEQGNPVINQWRFIRKTKSINHIFRNQLEPLLYYAKSAPEVS